MYQFKVGDVCVGRNFTQASTVRFNNIECTIVQCLGHYYGPENGIWYDVNWANGETTLTVARESKLKLKRPPEQLGSWDEIERMCNFNLKVTN